MTHDELIAKAIEWLRKIEPRMPDRLRGVTADRLPKRRVRDAVIIDFASDQDHGRIRVVMERDTGDVIGVTHSPPKERSEDRVVQPDVAPNGGPATSTGDSKARERPPPVN